jgi:hypothetical protein
MGLASAIVLLLSAPAAIGAPEDLLALPADTRAIVFSSPTAPWTNVDLSDLARFRDLRTLDLRHLGPHTETPDGVGFTRYTFRLTDVGLAALEPLASLEELDLMMLARITDDGLADLGKALPKLRRLSIRFLGAFGNGTPVTFRSLGAFPALADLDLTGCRGEHEAEWPANLATLKTLRSLTLRFCPWARGEALGPVATMPGIRELRLAPVVDGDLPALAKCAPLEVLDLSWSPNLTADGLAPLSALPALRVLDLHGCTRVTTIEPLRKLATLRELDLAGLGKLGDEGLAPVVGLRSIERLDIGGALVPRSSTGHPPCPVTEASLTRLATLPNLRRLRLSGVYQEMWGCRTQAQGPIIVDHRSPLPEEAVWAFRAARPDCEVLWP